MTPRKIKTTAKNVAVVEGDNLPAFLKDRMVEDAGKGVSSAAEDNLIPLLYVLQALSPQCNRRSPEYLEGAEAGSLWLRSSGLPPVAGDVGILFQPCFFSKDWVEWRPNRGGFAGRHDEKPESAVEKNIPKDNDPDHKEWVLPNGNFVQETRYHIGNIFFESGKVMPYVIPFTSSGHTVSKSWMVLMNNKTMPGVKGPAPSFSCFYRLTTKERSNTKGTWMVIDITDAGWVQSADDYERGYALNAAFGSGEKGIETPEQDVEGSSTARGNAAM